MLKLPRVEFLVAVVDGNSTSQFGDASCTVHDQANSINEYLSIKPSQDTAGDFPSR
jgi:hypothetical protein